MHKFTISVAAASALAALLAAAPANAERNPGAVKNGGGQCWTNSRGSNGEFGFWASCPQPASTTATTRQRRPATNASR